ncbi:hypothetical protein AV530_005853 [Patagioenas fasciata monilis]|uniref:Uncharacterized protein n=1 Tax=Patagioenas fasciata monilis TaxID=372326 RepID=A0A1V4JMW2_PATFA|nr:hypothetical protein AV530_005853 [Patagioenas fasciata monilis]
MKMKMKMKIDEEQREFISGIKQEGDEVESEEEEEGPSTAKQPEGPSKAKQPVKEELIYYSLSLKELRTDFSCHEGEPIVTWLIQSWDSGANSLELDGNEARKLGSLGRDGGIDKAIAKKKQNQSLWRKILSAVKIRDPLKHDTVGHATEWTTMEKGIIYLRELAVREIIYSDPQTIIDPDEVPCTRGILRKCVQSTPPSYAHTLGLVVVSEDYRSTVGETANMLRYGASVFRLVETRT